MVSNRHQIDTISSHFTIRPQREKCAVNIEYFNLWVAWSWSSHFLMKKLKKNNREICFDTCEKQCICAHDQSTNFFGVFKIQCGVDITCKIASLLEHQKTFLKTGIFTKLFSMRHQKFWIWSDSSSDQCVNALELPNFDFHFLYKKNQVSCKIFKIILIFMVQTIFFNSWVGNTSLRTIFRAEKVTFCTILMT